MSERMIRPVADNNEKQQTYRQLMGRYNAAIKYKFYLEAMMIDYSMIEDRLTSMLYHMGIMPNRKTLKVSASKTKNQIREIVYSYIGKEKPINLNNITDKITVIKAVITWVNEAENVKDDKYLRVLKKQCESLDIGELLDILSDIEDWCKYRNEVMHAALNKNIESLYSDIYIKVEDGMQYARFLDSQVKVVKAGNKIRRAMNLVVEK